ncbi:LLM class flavin-dependent oxidoreductase [Actinoplanes sp. G11-F43]|uniref:LLM class flavin-dependent oxidoreductase n=1 Tax=Actinoplanes sp. G11-F43 TaxID=3424130 RepID=UPI003D34805A
MELGIGLPTMIPGMAGADLIASAVRAEQRGFASLGVLDRLWYDGYEPLVTLAAAAGATRRIRLTTTILIAAYRGDRSLLAKQLAGVHRLSGGRLVVGVAAGGREDDFTACGTPYQRRGRRLDTLLGDLRRTWSGGDDPLVPGPRLTDGGPPLLVGGHTPRAMRRAATHASGWIAGGSSASSYGDLAERARQAWRDAGRTDPPRLVAIANVALGRSAADRAGRFLLDYYGFLGWKAELAVKSLITEVGQLREFTDAYRAVGCDELILFPCVPEPEHVDVLAEAVLR